MTTVPENAARFDGLATVYDRCRPSYPAAAIAYIMQHCGLRPGMLAVDVGCGTGISSRLLAGAGLRVIGIEPNADMRAAANSAAAPAGAIAPEYRNGSADATGLHPETVDLVLAAQAFHWFATDAALTEFQRILKQDAKLVLMWNEQARDDPFTAAYVQALIDHSPLPEIASEVHADAGKLLLQSPLFRHAEHTEFPNAQKVTAEQLLGRAFSASFAPKAPDARASLQAALEALHQRFQHQGLAVLRYRTIIDSAQK